MNILIVRHAIAVPRSADILDHARPLTSKGIARFEGVVRGLKRLDVRLDRIYYSPWVRATQTAQLLETLLHRHRGEVIATELLAASPTPELLAQLEGENVALIGHNPWLGELIALLVTGDATRGTQFHLKKGGVAFLEGEPQPAGSVLNGLYAPGVLRRVESR